MKTTLSSPPMPSAPRASGNLNLDKILALAPGGLGRMAFETGTFLGRTSKFLGDHFNQVITMELSEELHREAKATLAPDENITCLLGNSAELLCEILPTFPPEESAFFFLDAHWSGDQTVDWQNSRWKGFRRETAHLGRGATPTGPEQCPLLEELAAIAEHWNGSAHILIDDTRNIPAEGPGKKDFAFLGEDWSHLSRQSVLAAVGARLANFHLLTGPEQYFLSLHRK